jgi:hypothetical protein
MASASTTTIDFLNGDPSGDNNNGLDNISINVTPTGTPEPGTLSLFALGAAAGCLLRRKRTK